jgi:hypothetical protein
MTVYKTGFTVRIIKKFRKENEKKYYEKYYKK